MLNNEYDGGKGGEEKQNKRLPSSQSSEDLGYTFNLWVFI